jgi:hypothetical protein
MESQTANFKAEAAPELPPDAEQAPTQAARSEGPPAAVEPQTTADTPADTSGSAESSPEDVTTGDEQTPEQVAPVGEFEQLVAREPELRALIENKPELKEALDRAFSAGAEAAEYKTVFANPEEARYAATQAQTLGKFDELFYSEEPDSARALLNHLYENQFLRDPDSGEFARGDDGRPISTGAYERLTAAYRSVLFDTLESRAQAAGDERLLSAVALIRGQLKGEAPNASAPANPQLPESVRERLARLEELEREHETAGRERARIHHENLVSDVHKVVRNDVEEFLKSASLPRYVKAKVVEDVIRELDHQAGLDNGYQLRMQALIRNSRAGEAARSRVVAAARSHARNRISAVAQPILSNAFEGMKEQQTARLAKVADQRKRVEVKSAGAAPGPSRQMQGDRVQAMEKKMGRRLSDREILDL